MAFFDQLLIQGIRSVGIDPSNAHAIKFLSPLTIISGPNGTGKTTIIEALNFATTATLPAGSYQTFVHSLEIAKKSRVDGLVKLQFKDVKNNNVVVTRRICAQVANTKAKVKCAAEESTIQIKTPSGIEKSLSSKVVDTKKEVLNLLGVPAAILSNVVFCHQEDSCWPLSEPKELKMRFDKIFQLTAFVKAIEQMKKLKKEYENELKVLVAKKSTAEVLIKEKARLLKEQSEAEKSKKTSTARLSKLSESIKKLNQEIEDLSQVYQQVSDIERKEELLMNDLRNVKEQLQSIQVQNFSGTEDKLQEEIRSLESSSEYISLASERQNLDSILRHLEGQLADLRGDKKVKEKKLAKLQADEQIRAEKEKEVLKLEEEVRTLLDLPETAIISKQLKAGLRAKKLELEELKERNEKNRNSNQAIVDEATKEVTRLECSISNIDTSIDCLDSEVLAINKRLKEAANSQAELSKLSSEVASLESKLNVLPDVDENKIQDLRKKRQAVQVEVDGLRRKCAEAEKFADAERERQRKTVEKGEAEATLQDLLMKHERSLELFSLDRIGPWRNDVENIKKKEERQLAAKDQQMRDVQANVLKEKEEVKRKTSERARISAQIVEIENKILEECGCSPESVASKLKDVRRELTEVRKELEPLSTKASLYEKWSADVAKKSCCPLCERKFTSKSGAADLSQKLMNMSLSMPEDIERLEDSLKKLEDQDRALTSGVIYCEQLAELRKNLGSVEVDENVTSQLEAELEKMKIEVKTCSERHQTLLKLQADVSFMDLLHSTKSRLDAEIVEANGILLPTGLAPYVELKQQLEEKEAEVRSLVTENEKLQETASSKNVMLEKLHSLRDRRMTLGETAAQITHLQDQITAKENESRQLQSKRKEVKLELAVAKNNLEDVQADRTRVEQTARRKEEEMASSYSELQSIDRSYNELKTRLEDFGGITEKITQCETEIAEHDKNLSALESRKKGTESQLLLIEHRETRKKVLNDQMNKLRLERKMNTLNSQLEELRANVQKLCDGERADVLERKIQTNVRNRDQFKLEQERINGQVEEVDKKAREAASSLKQKQYSHAEKNFRDIIVDKVVCEKSVEDLQKYGQILDDGIMKFHSDKMAAINEILDDLWRRVYKGGDIESIKIRAEPNNSDKSTDKRKSYDYRVVMVVEGGVELDMRERCSAGQKMLACILIRIALADVFGGQCSIIALDEPTTNLDIHKIDHMAEMLNDLIAARRTDSDDDHSGRQFQMIVITHDSRLVEKLTMGCRPDFYYQLGKNHQGLSFIQRLYPDGHTEAITR